MTDLINELKKFILTGQALAEQGECLEPSIIDVLNEIERLEKGQTLPIDSVALIPRSGRFFLLRSN
jgi:hypothetical protein